MPFRARPRPFFEDKNLHYNVTQLTVGGYILFAKEIMLKIITLEKQGDKQPGHQPLIRRYQEKKQLEMIEKWIQMGQIDFNQLKEKQQEAIKKQRNT